MNATQAARDAVTFRSLPITLLLFLLALYTLLRVALLVYTGTDLVSFSDWPQVLVKGLWFDLVGLPPPAARVDAEYRAQRWRVFLGIFFGYAGFYLVRNNFSLALPEILKAHPEYTKAQLGGAITPAWHRSHKEQVWPRPPPGCLA